MTAKLSKLERETTGLKVFPLFTLVGWILIGFSLLVLVTVLAPTGASYWGANAKVTRDAAEVGSVLLAQLATLAWWPKLIPPLLFYGGCFLYGRHRHGICGDPKNLRSSHRDFEQSAPTYGKELSQLTKHIYLQEINDGKYDTKDDETLSNVHRDGFYDCSYCCDYRRGKFRKYSRLLRRR